MADALKVVVVDDSFDKFAMLRRAMGAVGSESAFAGCELLHTTRANTLVERPVEELADVDAFFVDFDLQTTRYGQDGPMITVSTPPEFVPDPAVRRRVEVQVTTGMGVLLYLDELFRSAEYLVARGERAPALVYTFADLAECRARYFTAAAHSWFGVPLFPVAPTHQMVANLELHPALGDDAQTVATSAPLLDALLNYYAEATPPSWVTPRGSDAFNWLRALGRHGCAPSTATYVPALVTNAKVNPTELLHDTLVARLYRKVETFESAFGSAHALKGPDQDAKTSAASRRLVREILAGELIDSELFWTAPDVRAALVIRRPLVARRKSDAAEAEEAARAEAAAKAEAAAQADAPSTAADTPTRHIYDSDTRKFLRDEARRRR